VEFAMSLGTAPVGDSRVVVIANSEFVAARARHKFGRPVAIVPSAVRPEDYVATDRTPRFVTFINPVQQKGVDLFLRLAALLPEVPFLCLEGWPLERRRRRALTQRLRQVPHVEFRRSTLDMAAVYAVTHLLLVPSTCEDAYPRVVLEAHASGIPVVAMRRGGIPDAVGAGGVLLSPEEPDEAWATAIRRILSSVEESVRLSQAARTMAQKADRQPGTVAQLFVAETSASCRG
jgi:glycosyltransferase involved in cell wall biosynthesis